MQDYADAKTPTPARCGDLDANSGGKTIVPAEAVTTDNNSFGLSEITHGADRHASSIICSALGEVLREIHDRPESRNHYCSHNGHVVT